MNDNAPKVIIYKKDRINYLLNGVSNFYKMPIEEIQTKRARTDQRYKAKRMTVKLLRDVGDLSWKEIKHTFTHGDESNGWVIYQRLNEDLSAGDAINNGLKREYKDLLKSMGL